jgi:outer membrane receptor protein involved in Fe transport
MTSNYLDYLKATVALGALALAPFAHAEDFNIPGGNLKSALDKYATQTGKPLLYVNNAVQGVSTPGVKGSINADDALSKILTGTGFVVHKDASGAVAIVKDRASDASDLPPDTILAQSSESAVELGAETVPEEVTVSASRISIGGYQQPTPVTSIGAEQIERDAKSDIGEVLQALPSMGASSSPNTSNGTQSISGGNAGANLVSLRNLGVTRTLVLFDGHRVVASDTGGGVDLNLIPATIVKRVDVVTGGASAAWGSDAVAGVVNIIVDNEFEGVKGNVEGEINQLGTRKTGKAELSYGTSFLGGKGHFILSGAYRNSPDDVVPQETDWYTAAALVNNPAYAVGNGQPQLIHARHVGIASGTKGGLITGGPLKGIQFVGPNGTPVPFDFGNVSGTLSNGGSAADPAYEGQADDLALPITTSTIYSHLSYDILPNVHATLEMNYGHSNTSNGSGSYTRLGNINVSIDNPYLDPTFVNYVKTNYPDLETFPFGTTNSNNYDGAEHNLGIPSVGNVRNVSKRTMHRIVGGLNGTLGDWSWDTYYEHSQINRLTTQPTNPLIANYNRAIDAVRDPVTGQIVCRSTLTDPTNGCQPLNLFGDDVASDAAIAYINGGDPYQKLALTQDAASISAQGQPFSTWAGPVSVAFGAEYRKEAVNQTADDLSYQRAFFGGNFQELHAHYTTREGFAEIQAPLLRDFIVEAVDFNAAGRITDYSTSGLVETWKLGITSDVNQDIRLRATWSNDIRAPSLTELFNPGSTSFQVVTDPIKHVSANIYAYNSGNPDLNPEVARTISGGVVLTPHWVPGLNVSVDWYYISIHGAIISTSFTQTAALCAAGQQIYCTQMIRNTAGDLIQINGSPLNASSQTNSGLDFQADYTTDLFAGTLNLSALGNYTDEDTTVSLGNTVDDAGSLNRDPPGLQGLPKFRATLSANYAEGPYSVTVQTRLFGAAKLNNGYDALATAGNPYVDNNNVDPVGYLDLRASYTFASSGLQLYGAIDNVLDTPPPEVPSSSASAAPFFYLATRADIYDALGRMFRVGVRANF